MYTVAVDVVPTKSTYKCMMSTHAYLLYTLLDVGPVHPSTPLALCGESGGILVQQGSQCTRTVAAAVLSVTRKEARFQITFCSCFVMSLLRAKDVAVLNVAGGRRYANAANTHHGVRQVQNPSRQSRIGSDIALGTALE